MDKDYREIYKPYRFELNSLFDNEKYIECLEKCKQFYDMLKREGTDEYHLFAAHHMFSKIYNRLDNLYLALTHGKKAEKYLDNQPDSVRCIHYWAMARYYENYKDNKKSKNTSLKYYFWCRDFYASIKDTRGVAMALNNIALIQEDTNLMEETLNLYKSLYAEGKIARKNLDRAYFNLCSLYIEKNSYNYLKVQSLLHNIVDEAYKVTLNEKMFSQSEKIV